MTEGRRPRGRAVSVLVLVLSSALALAGCADAPRPPGDGDADGSDDGDADAGPLGPYSRLVAGVDTVVLPEGSQGGVTGVVYDVTSGEGLSGVLVTAECLVLPLGATGFPRTLVTDEEGAFTLESAPELAACTAVAYDVDAEGYRPVVPLESGPVVDGFQHVVHAGMVVRLP